MKNLNLPSGEGLAARYPGDIGIENDPSVFFVERFESASIESLSSKWTHILNRDGKVLSFTRDVPCGSPSGSSSIKMVATRVPGQVESGGHLFTVFRPGYEEVYARYYAKFLDNHGCNSHFVQLAGAVNPPDYPIGTAGQRFDTEFCTGIEPDTLRSISTGFAPETSGDEKRKKILPPGIWATYTYWPDMHSWQTREGKPDGRPKPYYGNHMPPEKYIPVERDKWICIEFRIKLNSHPDKSDGEQTFWINGELAGHWGPGYPKGYWEYDFFYPDPDNPESAPFEGFRWRAAKGELFHGTLINKFWLQHYITENCFAMNEKYARLNPDYPINTSSATVLFSHIVLATKYIGPMTPIKE